VFDGDLPQHVGIDIAGDHIGELRIIPQGRPAENASEELGPGDLTGGVGGIHLPKLTVIAGPQIRKRRGQRAGAYAGDNFKLRPCSGIAPANQQAGPKCAVAAAAGDRQIFSGRV